MVLTLPCGSPALLGGPLPFLSVIPGVGRSLRAGLLGRQPEPVTEILLV